LKNQLEGQGYPNMMSPDENTPIRGTGKNGKTEQPAKKAAKRSRKTSQDKTSQNKASQKEAVQKEPSPNELAQQAAPETKQVEQPQEPIAVATVAMESPFVDAAPEAPAPIAPSEATEAMPHESAQTATGEPTEAAPGEPAQAAPREPEQTAPVNLQTITNAYGDFTRKSIEQTGSFFEQLAGVRSLSRAFELQGEFAKQTCETFFAESRKIRELHSELAMQRLRNLEGFMAWMKPTRSR
jgi:hypothetical protein